MEGLDPTKFIIVEAKALKTPVWRWKKPDPAFATKIQKSLQRFGQLKNIVIRRLPIGLEIVDGIEVVEAAKSLNIEALLAYDLGPISDHDAKLISMALDIKHELDVIALCKAIKDLPIPDTTISAVTCHSEDDIKDLRNLLNFNWEVFADEEDPTPSLFGEIK